MAKRRDLEVALLAVLTAALPGCAGKSILPSWSSGKSNSDASAKNLDDLGAKNSSGSSNSIGSGLKKTGSSISSALTIKPKVTPAEDPTSLNGKSPKLGPEIYISGARLRESRGDVTGAAEQYKKALEVAPKDTTALVGLARLHDRQGQFAEAEKLYVKASQADPKNALIYNDLGLCYARQKRLPESMATLQKATQHAPQNAMYRNNLAIVLVEAGRVDEAWAQLTALSKPADAHYNLGYLLHKHQQDELAAQHLQNALAIDPKMGAAQQLLAQIQGQAGMPEEVYAESPQQPASRPLPSYSVSDEALAPEEVLVADASSSGSEIVNPLAPATRRSATYRMPPTEEQSADPAPLPTRLPALNAPQQPLETEPAVEQTGPEINLEVPAMPTPKAKYPTRRTAHSDDVIQQPKNVIRLLGSEPLSAPIPTEE